jgi:hypothetical protein
MYVSKSEPVINSLADLRKPVLSQDTQLITS